MAPVTISVVVRPAQIVGELTVNIKLALTVILVVTVLEQFKDVPVTA